MFVQSLVNFNFTEHFMIVSSPSGLNEQDNNVGGDQQKLWNG